MEILRDIMEKDWVALRALALGDQYPELGIDELVSLAQKQRAEWEAAKMFRQKATS